MLTVTGTLKPGSTVEFGEESLPLMVGRTELKGRVHFLTSPILDTKTLGDDKTEELWRQIFNNSGIKSNNPQLDYSVLDSMPELPRTHAGWIAPVRRPLRTARGPDQPVYSTQEGQNAVVICHGSHHCFPLCWWRLCGQPSHQALHSRAPRNRLVADGKRVIPTA